jgi:MFS family permease
VNPDVRRIYLAQALRALVYGFGSVLLGAALDARGWSSTQAGALLTAVVAGTAIMSVVIGTFGDRIGRRRAYTALFLGLALTGLVFGLTTEFWPLVAVALLGALSTEVVESGPFTSLEQAILPVGLGARERTRVFGHYNAIASLVGSAGALLAGGPALLREKLGWVPDDERFFLVFVPVGLLGALVAASLSDHVEADKRPAGLSLPLERSRRNVARLSGLFAVDAFAGGFVVQSFIAYWFRAEYGVSTETLGAVFFVVGLLQAGSFLVATRLAERIGLLNTMVFTHLPSNLLLAAIPLSPSLGVAIALLFARFALSQMDVPTRQAYIAALVDPSERTAAAAYTNTARYAVRPLGPALAGLSQQMAFGLPFLIAGALKAAYDLALWQWFRRVPVDGMAGRTPTGDAIQSLRPAKEAHNEMGNTRESEG